MDSGGPQDDDELDIPMSNPPPNNLAKWPTPSTAVQPKKLKKISSNVLRWESLVQDLRRDGEERLATLVAALQNVDDFERTFVDDKNFPQGCACLNVRNHH